MDWWMYLLLGMGIGFVFKEPIYNIINHAVNWIFAKK